jgi:hypothetical protein
MDLSSIRPNTLDELMLLSGDVLNEAGKVAFYFLLRDHEIHGKAQSASTRFFDSRDLANRLGMHLGEMQEGLRLLNRLDLVDRDRDRYRVVVGHKIVETGVAGLAKVVPEKDLRDLVLGPRASDESTKAQPEVDTESEDAPTSFVCKGKTAKGKPCTRELAQPGYCFQHIRPADHSEGNLS